MLLGVSDTFFGDTNRGPRIELWALGAPVGFWVDVDEGHDPAVGFVHDFPGHVDAFEVDDDVFAEKKFGHWLIHSVTYRNRPDGV